MKVTGNYIAGEKERQEAYKTLIYNTNTILGICETLRCIYDLVADMQVDEIRKDMITERLIDAIIMAKKMDARLMYYKNKYHDETGHNGINIVALTNNAARKEMRRKRNPL
jgi:hypothetical protein